MIRAFNTFPKWMPGNLNGQNVKVNIGMWLVIDVDVSAKTINVTKPKPPAIDISALKDTNTIYSTVSMPPLFPGGQDSLRRYLVKNVNYPPNELKNHMGGEVILSFVVERNGSLSQFKVYRSPGEDFSSEAIRIMSNIKYISGKQNNIPVRVAYSTDIKFDPDNPEKH